MNFFRYLICSCVISTSLLIAACGSETDNSIPPTPLSAFHKQITFQRLWSINPGSGTSGYYVQLHPVTNGKSIFFANYSGSVFAADVTTGKIIWQKKFKAHISSGLTIGDHAVYVATNNAKVSALDTKTGKTLWSTDVSNLALASPKYTHHMVLIHTTSGTLTALSSTDGQQVWRYYQTVPSLTLHAASQPQIAGRYVVCGFSNGELVTLNLFTGKPIWQQHVAFPSGDNPVSQMVDITVNPIVKDGIVYVATYQGRVAAYSLDNGQPIWQHNISSYAGIAIGNNQLFISDANSVVWSFDLSSGAVNWKQTALKGRQITGPVIFSNKLVVADRYGYLHALSKDDGQIVGRFDIGNGVITTPLAYKNNLYVYTQDGTLLASQSR